MGRKRKHEPPVRNEGSQTIEVIEPKPARPRRLVMILSAALGYGTRKAGEIMATVLPNREGQVLSPSDVTPAPGVLEREIETLINNPHLWRVEDSQEAGGTPAKEKENG